MKITKEEFKAYLKVQKSGLTNMFRISKVSELSGLDKDKVLEIMQNYGNLSRKYNKKGDNQ
jgi:3-oxoacyl-[acyl-carrier-protein] synthase III